MGNNIELADRLDAVSEELTGIAQILFIMYEKEFAQEASALHLLTLSKIVEGYGKQVSDLARNT